MSQTLSIDEAAAYLGVGRSSLRSYIKSGLIPVVQWPGQRRQRLSIAALDGFRKSCEGPIHGPIQETDVEIFQQNPGQFEMARKTGKSREAQLDEKFARK